MEVSISEEVDPEEPIRRGGPGPWVTAKRADVCQKAKGIVSRLNAP